MHHPLLGYITFAARSLGTPYASKLADVQLYIQECSKPAANMHHSSKALALALPLTRAMSLYKCISVFSIVLLTPNSQLFLTNSTTNFLHQERYFVQSETLCCTRIQCSKLQGLGGEAWLSSDCLLRRRGLMNLLHKSYPDCSILQQRTCYAASILQLSID